AERQKSVVEQQLTSERAKNEILEQVIKDKEEETNNLEQKVNGYDALFAENKKIRKILTDKEEKVKNLEKNLSIIEIKFNNSQANASHLSKKLEEKDQKLQTLQKQNNLLNSKLDEAQIQLLGVQTENYQNYWENEAERATQEKAIQKSAKEIKKLE